MAETGLLISRCIRVVSEEDIAVLRDELVRILRHTTITAIIARITRDQVLLRELVKRTVLNSVLGLHRGCRHESPAATASTLVTRCVHHTLLSPINILDIILERRQNSLVTPSAVDTPLLTVDCTDLELTARITHLRAGFSVTVEGVPICTLDTNTRGFVTCIAFRICAAEESLALSIVNRVDQVVILIGVWVAGGALS